MVYEVDRTPREGSATSQWARGRGKMRGQERCAGALIALAAKAEKRGDYTRARRHYEQALAMRREHCAAADPLAAKILDKLGAVLNTLGDYADR